MIATRDELVARHGLRRVVGSVEEGHRRRKERVFSFRDEFGQWDPKAQRPELWNLYDGRHRKGEPAHSGLMPASF